MLLCAFGATGMAWANPVLNEFMASNEDFWEDPHEPGAFPDWIELYNPTASSINLAGYYLTDNRSRLPKWRIPDGISLPANRYLVFIADDDEEQGERHTNFRLDSDGGFLALISSDGSTVIDSITYTKQYSDVSYGRYPDGADDWYFFETPTRNAKNNQQGYIGKVEKVVFSKTHVFHNSSFSLELSVDTPNAKIYYTLDGTEPQDRQSGGSRLYTGAIPINTTTFVRARAFLSGWQSKQSVTQTYIFLDDVLNQPEDPPGFPLNWGHEGFGDYEMDPDVVLDPQYSGTIVDNLKSIPSMSLVMDVDDWFSEERGIYIEGELDERRVSVEYITNDGTPGFQENCAVMIVGGTSVNRWKMDKLSMRLKFQTEYGDASLNYPLFGENATDEFETIVLDARANNSWAYGGGVRVQGRDLVQGDIAQYTRDQLAPDLQLALGGYSVHGRPVHLYLNGLYWGLYWVHERPDEHFAEAYLGGDDSEYDVLKHNSETVVNGSDLEYRRLLARVNSGMASSDNYALVKEMLDIPHFIDYMIINFYLANWDWAHQNWYATFNRVDPEGRWRFHCWDSEHIMEDIYADMTTKNNNGGPTYIHQQLSENAEYRQQFADHVHRHFFNDGMFTIENISAFYENLLDKVDRAVVGESARWGDNHRDWPYTRNEEWLTEKFWLLDEFFVERGDVVLEQFRDRGLYPDLAAPSFRINGAMHTGGRIEEGDNLSMVGSGTIYYTTNGTDPWMAETTQDQTVYVPQDAPKKVHIPTSNIGIRWRIDPYYDDTSWLECTGSPGGVGYERDSGYEPFITLDTSDGMYDLDNNASSTCYIRIPFNMTVAEIGKLSRMALRIRYDDGFAAFINGRLIASANAEIPPPWDAAAQDNHEANQVEVFDVSDYISELDVGMNVLAIQGLNVHSRSSDFIITAELVGGEQAGGGSLSPDAIEYTEPLALHQSTRIKARATNGREWSALHEAVFAMPVDLSPLKLTELHFHPLEHGSINDRELEFLELKNINSSALNLSLAEFVNGVSYTFPSGTILEPGQFIVLASNPEHFQGRYSFAPFGDYDGYLDNAGERLTLVTATGDTILNIRFNDKDPWPSEADGQGPSLVARDVNPQGDPAQPSYWGLSYFKHGSPGRDDKTATDITEPAAQPQAFRLYQNYPNPFNPRTRIRFDVPRDAHIFVRLYNALGQQVDILTDKSYSAGSHTITWSAENPAAGVYFVRLDAEEFSQTIKVLLIK